MAIELKMPALSPTMEEGTLAKWLVKEGDTVSSGDLIAEIETDKATMEFESIDEGVITKIVVPEGTDGVKVGTVIAVIQSEDDEAELAKPAAAKAIAEPSKTASAEPVEVQQIKDKSAAESRPSTGSGLTDEGSGVDRIIASPLAKRIAADRGVDLSNITGTGPNGRIVKADVEGAGGGVSAAAPASGGAPVNISPMAKKMAQERGVDLSTVKGTGPNGSIVRADIEAAAAGGGTSASVTAPAAAAAPSAPPAPIADFGIPFEEQKLSNMRKTIAKRLSQSMQEAPHIYLTVDIRLDALLKLRGELNASLESRGVKLSVNDMLIKALALALERVPSCNVSFAGDVMRTYSRSDISVAVSIPGGLITPIIVDAGNKSLSKISTEMADLGQRAKEGKLQPNEFQGGTASISNMGMMGIKQFTAVINPPQSMIMAIGAGEKRPYVVDDALQIATVMSATGSFDHRAIDGADGAQLMKVFKELVEKPLGLVA